MSAFHILLAMMVLLFGFLKLLNFMRIYEDFGHQVYLIRICILDMCNFMIFLFLFIAFFYAFYSISGAQFSADDYPNLNKSTIIMLQTWRNSMGDISAPIYPIWTEKLASQDSGEQLQGMIMLTTIWTVWLLNQLIILICLFNFLIAIVS